MVIPRRFAFPPIWPMNADIELEIVREGDEIRIRPARHSLSGVMMKFARFSPDFMVEGRGDHEQAERDSL
jgi:antitoxin VapB